MASAPLEGGAPRRRPVAHRWRRLAWVGLGMALLGEAGHQVLDRVGHTFAHHLFHVLFGAGAVVVFVALMVSDIRRNGWPTFSWRLRPRPGDRG